MEKNKKVLRERKNHTARRVSSTPLQFLPRGGGSYLVLSEGLPHPVLAADTTM